VLVLFVSSKNGKGIGSTALPDPPSKGNQKKAVVNVGNKTDLEGGSKGVTPMEKRAGGSAREARWFLRTQG